MKHLTVEVEQNHFDDLVLGDLAESYQCLQGIRDRRANGAEIPYAHQDLDLDLAALDHLISAYRTVIRDRSTPEQRKELDCDHLDQKRFSG